MRITGMVGLWEGMRNKKKKREYAVSGMYKALHGGSLRTWGNEPTRTNRERSLRKQTAVCSTGTAAGAPSLMKAAS